jgi:hypothetical protein
LTDVVAGTGVVCQNTISSDAFLTITEGFAGAFVQHTGVAGFPITANSRPAYGGNANTEFIITVSALPAGVTLNWPATVTGSVAGAGSMLLVSVSSDTTTATYQFVSLNQALSDQNTESFTFDVGLLLTGTAQPGTSTVQAQMAPLSTSSAVPKFKSQILNSPADVFITINRCVTYLLFPYVAHGFGGFDTGLAIANTSFDSTIFPVGLGANPQDGDLTIYYFKQFASGGTAPDPLAYDAGANDLSSGVLEAGNTWINTMSAMDGKVPGFADSVGWMLAKCQFQNAHGYAYVAFQLTTQNGVAQSYVANVIPDPQSVKMIRPFYLTTAPTPRWASTSDTGGENLNN